jgi:hypothetical protein
MDRRFILFTIYTSFLPTIFFKYDKVGKPIFEDKMIKLKRPGWKTTYHSFSKSRLGCHFSANTLFHSILPTAAEILKAKNKSSIY